MKDLRTPVAGPWLALSNNRCDGSCSLGDVVRTTWFVLNGIGQAGGLAIVLEGLLLRTGGEAPSSGPLLPRSTSPSAPPEASPPAEPGNGKPLFFLPTPNIVGRDGIGVGWGGVFLAPEPMSRPGLRSLRALALATDTSDVVGTVELCCYDEGLLVHFVRISPYAPSYAVVPPVRGREALLPYDAVREAWDDGEALRLTLQHARLPYRRLALTHVTRDDRYDHRSGHRQRVWSRALVGAAAFCALGVWVPLAQLLAPGSAALWGALGALGVAAVASSALRELGRRSVLGGEASAAERRAFFLELATHLPPSLVRDSAPPSWRETATSPFVRGRPVAARTGAPGEALGAGSPGGAFEGGAAGEALVAAQTGGVAGALGPGETAGAAGPGETGGVAGPGEAGGAAGPGKDPRARGPREAAEGGWRWPAELSPTLVAAAATALLGLAVLVASPLGGDERDVEAPVPTNEAIVSAAPAGLPELAPPKPEPAAMPSETCLCQVPLSTAVPQKVPRLTLLPAVRRRSLDPQKPSLDLELAIVNNSASDMREPQGVVSFQRPGARPGDPMRPGNDQSFYFEGNLESGAALKWRLRGRGTTFQIATSEEGYLGDSDLATGDAFAKLLGARTRSVRLHGAAMLARMRDERASAAVEKLREASLPDEAPFLDALSRAAAPVYACRLEAEASEAGPLRVSFCVMNTGDEDTSPLDAELWLSPAPARSPVSTGEAELALVRSNVAERLRVPARTGAVVRGEIDAAAAQGVEIVADVVLRASSARSGSARPAP
jgi:hypothetical protein